MMLVIECVLDNLTLVTHLCIGCLTLCYMAVVGFQLLLYVAGKNERELNRPSDYYAMVFFVLLLKTVLHLEIWSTIFYLVICLV